MNNKGFAITGIIYSVLIIFLVTITTILFNLQNRKTILDELKMDAVDAVESENNYEYLLSEINTLKAQMGSTDVSSLGDGTVTGALTNLKDAMNNDVKVEQLAMPLSGTPASNEAAFTFDMSAFADKTVIAAIPYCYQNGYAPLSAKIRSADSDGNIIVSVWNHSTAELTHGYVRLVVFYTE